MGVTRCRLRYIPAGLLRLRLASALVLLLPFASHSLYSEQLVVDVNPSLQKYPDWVYCSVHLPLSPRINVSAYVASILAITGSEEAEVRARTADQPETRVMLFAPESLTQAAPVVVPDDDDTVRKKTYTQVRLHIICECFWPQTFSFSHALEEITSLGQQCAHE